MSEYYKDNHRYEDMLDMQHHQSRTRARMSLHDRAAQFAPFAALTGYGEEIEEAGRVTENQINMDDAGIEMINQKLFWLSQHLEEKPVIAVTYFKPDRRKQGGAYLTDIGIIKKFEQTEKCVIMDSGIKIPMEAITAIHENADKGC